jgi:hypothetical protein
MKTELRRYTCEVCGETFDLDLMEAPPEPPANVIQPGFSERMCWVLAVLITIGIVGSTVVAWLSWALHS